MSIEKLESRVLTPAARRFLAELHERFELRRRALLEARRRSARDVEAGRLQLDFLEDTREIRESEWQIAPIPEEIRDRRVEITGPTDRKRVIQALGSGARVYMADFEDAHSPVWSRTLEGQVNLADAVRREIDYQSPEGKSYRLPERPAVLFCRPRGWHLVEPNYRVQGQAIAATFLDFGLFFHHNAAELVRRGSRPYFYLAKLESHLEARLWRDVFRFAEDHHGIERGTLRATVLVETFPAAFQMDEILFELRDYSAGLNCGRWDYLFSFIKTFHHRPDFVLPDRSQVTMNCRFLSAYARLLVATCHRRGAHAMGGMAAQIPINTDPRANAEALEKVRQDKVREVQLGHDGTWVAHPGLVAIATEVFDECMPEPNQISRPIDPSAWRIDAAELTDLSDLRGKPITPEGMETNVEVALRYMEAWLSGTGAVPIHHLMEDAATAEISRAQLWQWLHHGRLSLGHFEGLLRKHSRQSAEGNQAGRLLQDLVLQDQFMEFMTPGLSSLLSGGSTDGRQHPENEEELGGRAAVARS
jgi:malate synthase